MLVLADGKGISIYFLNGKPVFRNLSPSLFSIILHRFSFRNRVYPQHCWRRAEVPDDALPAAIGAAKYVAVGGQPLFWHLAAPFLNHQQYSRGLAYVYPYVANRTEKNLPAFWWIYTRLGR